MTLASQTSSCIWTPVIRVWTFLLPWYCQCWLSFSMFNDSSTSCIHNSHYLLVLSFLYCWGWWVRLVWSKKIRDFLLASSDLFSQIYFATITIYIGSPVPIELLHFYICIGHTQCFFTCTVFGNLVYSPPPFLYFLFDSVFLLHLHICFLAHCR